MRRPAWSRRTTIAAATIPLAAAAVLFALLRSTVVTVADVAVRDLRPAVHAVGTVEAKSVVQIAARVAGRIADVRVDQGHVVERGQLLVRLDDAQQAADLQRAVAALESAEAQLRDLEAGSRVEEIAEARANVARSRAQLDDLLAGARPQEVEDARERVRIATATRVLTESDLKRATVLLERELVAVQEVDRARQAHQVAAAQERAAEEALRLVIEGPRRHQIDAGRAQLKASEDRLALLVAGPRAHQVIALRAQAREARAALALARERLADTHIVSPFDGDVVSRDLEPGATVNPGTPILKLADPRTAWVTVHVDERETARLGVGDAAEITLRSRPGAPLGGRITRIRRESDRVTEQLAVDVAFDAPPPRLTLGEQVDALLMPTAHPALALPAGALVRGRDGTGAWTVVDGRLRFARVRVGALGHDGWVEALNGLTAGDRVVVAPGRLAESRDEGRRVRAR